MLVPNMNQEIYFLYPTPNPKKNQTQKNIHQDQVIHIDNLNQIIKT